MFVGERKECNPRQLYSVCVYKYARRYDRLFFPEKTHLSFVERGRSTHKPIEIERIAIVIIHTVANSFYSEQCIRILIFDKARVKIRTIDLPRENKEDPVRFDKPAICLNTIENYP